MVLFFECAGAAPKRLARSKEGCCICGKKTDKTKFRNVAGDEDKENRDVGQAFGLINFGSGDMCAACYRALRKSKSCGKKAVSVRPTSELGLIF